MNRRLSVLLLGAAVAATAFAMQSMTLKRVATVGEVNEYKLNVVVDFQGTEVNFSARTVERVLSVEGGKIVTENETKDAKIDLGGQEQPVDDSKVKTTLGPDGEIVLIEGEMMDESAYRFANLMAMRWPGAAVEKGTKWTVEQKADSKRSTPATTFGFEIQDLMSMAGRDVVKVGFNIKETEGDTPASSEGVMYIDIKTGLMVKTEGKMENANIGGMVLNAKFSNELVSK
jgi:hypothetical protein